MSCSILENLNGSDIRVLVKYLEERSQMVGLQYNSCINILTLFNHYQVKFSKAFPSPKTHSYFMFMDSLSYHDKLLDAFETRSAVFMIINNYYDCFRFGDKIQEGIDYVESYCKNNAHI